jgi:hypothetical protein
MNQSKEPRYVQRDPVTRGITGHFANPQPGYAEEELPSDHEELRAFNEKRRAARLQVSPYKALEARVAQLEAELARLSQRS